MASDMVEAARAAAVEADTTGAHTPRPFDSDAFANTLLPRAICDADGLASALRHMHGNAHRITEPEQLDRIDSMADALNDRVRHGTAQVRQVLAAARRAAAPITMAEAGWGDHAR